jgi:hypothetical protein
MSVRGDALALLGRRDHTIAELRDKLLGRGHDAHDVDVVVMGASPPRTSAWRARSRAGDACASGRS